MVTQILAGLKDFCIFNSTLSTKEGEELKKILYYYPITDNTDTQIKNVGLAEGIIKFTQTFNPSTPVSNLHTNETRQLYYQPEKDYWMVMTLKLNHPSKEKDGLRDTEELEDDIDDGVYEAILKQAYLMYRLFWGTFKSTKNIDSLKVSLEIFYRAYLQSLKLGNSDILSIFSGIQYLPLDKQSFLKVQCFVNYLESTCDLIQHTSFLYNDYLIWSGIEPSNMQVIYQYLIGTLLPANVEVEMQGGSIPRNSPSVALRHGRFITGPSNLKLAKNVGKVPKIHLFSEGKCNEYYLVVYRLLSATVCLYIKGDTELTLTLFKQLDEVINKKLTSIVSNIAEYCSKQVLTPCNLNDATPRYIYFNKLNLAYKSTVHLDNKQSGNLSCPKESVRIAAEMKGNIPFLGQTGETIVKTMNDYWVVMKLSNHREFYIALQQKNASLIDISEEVKKLCGTELKDVFFNQF